MFNNKGLTASFFFCILFIFIFMLGSTINDVKHYKVEISYIGIATQSNIAGPSDITIYIKH